MSVQQVEKIVDKTRREMQLQAVRSAGRPRLEGQESWFLDHESDFALRSPSRRGATALRLVLRVGLELGSDPEACRSQWAVAIAPSPQLGAVGVRERFRQKRIDLFLHPNYYITNRHKS